MNTKKYMFLSLLLSFVALAISIVCACVLNFNTVSLILLAGVVVTTVVANILCWRMAVKANQNK